MPVLDMDLRASNDVNDNKRQRVNADDDGAMMRQTMMDMMAQQQQSFLLAMQQQQAAMMEMMQKALDNQAIAKSNASPSSTLSPAPNAGVDATAPALKEVKKVLTKEKFKFMKKVKTYLRATDICTSRKADADMMAEDATCSKYPKYVRPFKAPSSEGELDQVWSKVVDESHTISIKIEKGTSMRKAMEDLHWHCVKEQKAIFAESSSLKVEALKTASRKAVFAQTCKEAIELARSNDEALGMGLEGAKKFDCSEVWLEKEVENLYAEVVEDAVKEKKDDDFRTSKKVKESEVDSQIEKLAPEKVIADFVEKKVREATLKQ